MVTMRDVLEAVASDDLEQCLEAWKAASLISQISIAGGADLDRLASIAERCARAFLEVAKNLQDNADEARNNNAP